MAVDRRLVEAAALLHDVDKALPPEHPLKPLGHGRAGAEWLIQAGHPELARAVANHPVMCLEDAAAASWVIDGPLEERIVSYADKRATQRVVSLEHRFERWRKRHPEHRDELERACAQARRLEVALCDMVAIRPADVVRLRWVEEALRRAEANGRLAVKTEAALAVHPS